MKAQQVFIAERPLAKHCPELLHAAPDPADLLVLLARMGDRLARQLAGALAPLLLSGDAPGVRCLPPRTGTLAAIRDAAAHPLAANSLFAIGAEMTPLLVTMCAHPVFRIVDRAYGGTGVAPDPLPDIFPMAADLMIARIETVIAAQIGGAFANGTAAPPGARAGMTIGDIVPQRRHGDLASLAPFSETQDLAIVAIEITEAGAPIWHLTLGLPLPALLLLFGSGAGNQNPAARPPRAATSFADPIADVPLTLSALIVDMLVPFTTVAGLTPGQVLPVTVARSIPLRAGDVTVAHGTIGALDDHAAIQITSAFTR